MLHFKHPVDELWRRPRGGPPQAPVRCCVRRARRFEVSVARLDGGEAALLEALGAEEKDAAKRLLRMIERG